MQNIKTFFSMFGKLVKILNAKQKRQGIVLFFLLLITSILEMLGVSVIIPFIVAMLEPEKILAYDAVAKFTQMLNITSYRELMFLVAGGIIVVYVMKNGFILFVNYYQSNYRNTLEKDLNVKMLNSYMSRPYTFFLNTNSAEILRGISSDITNVASVIDSFTTFFAEGLSCLTIGIFLVCINPFMACSLVILAGVTALAMVLGLRKRISGMGVICREAFAEKSKYSYQAINGIKEITVAQRRDFFTEQYSLSAAKAARTNTKYLWISKLPSRLIETVFIAGLLILVCIGYDESGSSVDFITSLGAIGIAAVRILPSISSLAGSLNSLVYHRPSLEAAYDNIMEAEQYQGQARKEQAVSKDEQITFQSKVEIDGINWRYQPKLPLVLNELSFEIKKGESIALIGESGAGKSTLADVLLGLLRPEKGSVKVDGRDIYSILPTWSRMIGYVPQMVFLIDDTVRNNIAFGIREDEIDDEKVWRALEQAQLKKTVENMDKGLDTIVGERGIKISGGQRQRIAIARALYYNPDILILDEATSALDSDTEKAVMESIEALQGNKTLVIIAHRLSTIKKCDKIYEVKNGVVTLKDKSEVFKL